MRYENILPDAVFARGQLAITVSEEDTLAVLILALFKVCEGSTTWSSVTKLLTIVGAGNALIDNNDILLGLFADSFSEDPARYDCGSST